MKKFLSIVLLVFLSGIVFGQKPQRPSAKPATSSKQAVSKPKPKTVLLPALIDPEAEKAKLDAALALTSVSERTSALKKFIRDFPKSEHRARAAESLVTARAILGDEKLQASEYDEGIALFKLAVAEAPSPIPERLFNEIVSKFPANLFYRDQREAGVEVAEDIEKKAAGNAKQLLSLATFYLGIERGSDARRLAEKAIGVDPNSVIAYQTLGLAHRLNFDLEESAAAYSKALELDVSSAASKRSLAEMKRALGKPDEAAALYREIVAANYNDSAAATGLILSLFGSGKKAEAETEMARSLERNPQNLNLLAGAAYWYAANDSGDKAVELARKAVEMEPRYIWGHIALARGLMGQRRPVEAERVLVMARQYGNFPTLEYEIASARLMSGFYREAVEELQKSFSMKDGLVQTRLGGRVSREEKSFADLIAYERRASIFETGPADNPENAEKLKLLFEINQKLVEDAPDETELSALTDEFVKGEDKMKLHRQMYSATILLQKNVALPKVLELVKSAIGNADAGLEVSTPAAAVMASELYESRTIAFAKNEIIVVPEVPRQTLSAILRGRIEELTGWTLYQQKSYPEAVVRLRRAISVLPDKSAWWRSSMWRLGSALEADGKDKEALDSYIQSYKTDRPSALRYSVVETLYKKVHGRTEGLELKIGPNPLPLFASTESPKIAETVAKPVTPAAKQIKANVTANAPAAKTSVRESNVETAVAQTPNREIPTKLIEPPKIKEPIISAKQIDLNTQIAGKAPEVSEPKVAAVQEPEKPAATKTQITEISVKPVETVVPRIENVTPADKTIDEANKSTEVIEKPVESTEPKAVKESISEKPSEPKTQVAEVPVKAIEVSEPLVEPVSPTNKENSPETKIPDSLVKTNESSEPNVEKVIKESDPKTQVATIPAKTEEKIEPKVEDAPKLDKQNDTKILIADAPPKAADEIQPKVESAKIVTETSEAKNNSSEINKPEDIPQVSLPAETVKKTEADSRIAETASKATTTDKVLEKVEFVPPVQPVVEPPAKAQPSADEPKNLFRDPLPTDEPEPKIEPLPSTNPKLEKTPGTKTTVFVSDPIGNGKQAANTKDLFEPVIINVPGSSSKSAKIASDSNTEDDAVSSGASRVRVVDGKDIRVNTRCSIELSQDMVSLINDGGSLGVLARIEGDGDFKDVVTTSSSPKDIEVKAETELNGISARRFYVIRSVSTTTGVYRVTFESPCGKQEISVTVR
ncbi:MAG: tetratricopeptide repeat protein [Pyrinomonadaceae bacterium]